EFSPVPAAPVEEEEDPLPTAAEPMRRRPAPRIRPSSPRFRRQRSLSGPIVLITLLLAVAVGGYVGWPILSARFGLQRTAERPSVLLPMIPDDLVPQMRELAETAIADAIDEVDASAVPTGAPREPAAEWLAGVYLANASQFGSVEEFWSSIGSLAEDLRAADWSLYHEKMLDRVESEGLSQETAAIIVERADSGYAAAAGRRAQTYAALDRLVEAALDLHDFLVRSEASIEYRPASASTVDPVLEAVPSTPELGDRMWDMVDDITEALDALGSLDRVTRERLITAVKERLQNVGIQ
ncbi:MAG TPA: hypothetical protein VLA09_12840, partial [Longimicrobiales bacterium]|nr:hypothetical protein [Longimicrobiales bacterium]